MSDEQTCTPSGDPDEWTLQLLAHVLDLTEPAPDDAVSAAYAAIEMQSINDELAALVFDSLHDDELVATRAAEAEVRLLSFVNDHMTLDLELHADGRTIIGQLAPPTSDSVEIETDGGERRTVEADAFGRFRVTVDGGSIRFRVVGRLVTPWITR